MADDAADATYIAEVFGAARRWKSSVGRSPDKKPLRELIWFVWQRHRLGDCVRGKYPKTAPWTAAARAAYKENRRCKLVVDHVSPIHALIQRLIDAPVTTAELVPLLKANTDFCVITADEDLKLSRSGMAHALLDRDTRYRNAGIDLAGIRPLSDS